VVWHIGSGTGIASSPFKAFYLHRNQYFNLIKNFPFPFLLRGLLSMPQMYWLLTMSASNGSGVSAKLKNKSGWLGMANIVFASLYEVLINLPSLWKKRRLIQRNRTINCNEFGELLTRFQADINKMIFGS